MDKIIIFYSASTRNGCWEVRDTVCKLLENEFKGQIQIYPEEKDEAHNIPGTIQNHIDTSDIFVADLTPDYPGSDEKKACFNPSVMFEVGYGLGPDTFLFYDDIKCPDIGTHLPIFLNNLNRHRYDTENIDQIYELIKDKINDLKNGIDRNAKWVKKDFTFSKYFMSMLSDYTNLNIRKIIAKSNKSWIILSLVLRNNDRGYYVDLSNRKLKRCGNIVCDLARNEHINTELRHIELVLLSVSNIAALYEE